MCSQYRTATAVQGYEQHVEDRAAVLEFPGGLVLVVADGAGGTSGGGKAAEALLAHATQCLAGSTTPTDPMTWVECLRVADAAIAADPIDGETTAVVLCVTPAGIAGASVGDSAAWIIEATGHMNLTQHQRRKPLIGSGAALPVPCAAPELCVPLLTATDGLFKYASAEQICNVVRWSKWEDAPSSLIDLVRLPSGGLQDDVGVILCAPV